MGLVSQNSEIEAWLQLAASSWTRVPDRDYRTLVLRWRTAYSDLISGESGLQHKEAPRDFDARLPADVVVFNGLAISRAASTGGAGAVHAYSASRLRRVDEELANSLDLIVSEASLAFCCVFTHEAQSLAYPIFGEHAAF